MPYFNLSSQASRPPEGFYLSEVRAARTWPVRTFLPTGYEPNYPYPLLVLFHGHGSTEERVLRLAPRVSRRNFLCISLRGPELVGPRLEGGAGFGWGRPGQYDALVEDYVFRAVEQTRRHYHVHSERIYLVGVCEGAAPAYRVGLTFPKSFAGLASLNGSVPRPGAPLLRLAEVRSLAVHVGHGIANAKVPLALARYDFRVFYAAGMPVRLHTYPTTHRLHPDMLRDVNRWVVGRCNQ